VVEHVLTIWGLQDDQRLEVFSLRDPRELLLFSFLALAVFLDFVFFGPSFYLFWVPVEGLASLLQSGFIFLYRSSA
jgi:hypothetical protein